MWRRPVAIVRWNILSAQAAYQLVEDPDNEAETLRYLVVDELHTFDGAQGTDLACLIRRLKARLGCPKDCQWRALGFRVPNHAPKATTALMSSKPGVEGEKALLRC